MPTGLPGADRRQFEGDYKLEFHLAPPLFSQPRSGDRPAQQEGVRRLDAAGLPMLAKLKGLRGTALDLFGYTAGAPRRAGADRRIRGAGRRTAVGPHAGQPRPRGQLASVPEDIRGYGHVKDAHLEKAKRKQAELLHQWRTPDALKVAAE